MFFDQRPFGWLRYLATIICLSVCAFFIHLGMSSPDEIVKSEIASVFCGSYSVSATRSGRSEAV